MHFKSDNKEIKINDKTDEVIENPFKSLFNRYQNNLEMSMRSSDFINKSKSCWIIYIFSWLGKNKKAVINPINKKEKCFQYLVTVALIKYFEIIIKIKSFINKYTWEGIDFQSEKDEWKTFEENNLK